MSEGTPLNPKQVVGAVKWRDSKLSDTSTLTPVVGEIGDISVPGVPSGIAFEKVFHRNFLSQNNPDCTPDYGNAYGLATSFQLYCSATGMIEIEFINAMGNDHVQIQYAKLRGLVSQLGGDGDNCILSNVEMIDYREIGQGQPCTGPLKITYDPGDTGDLGGIYPTIKIFDGSNEYQQVITVRARLIGVSLNGCSPTVNEFNLALIDAETNNQDELSVLVPWPVAGIQTATSATQTFPLLAKMLILNAGASDYTITLQPARCYKPGEIIYIKDAGGVLNGNTLYVPIDSGDAGIEWDTGEGGRYSELIFPPNTGTTSGVTPYGGIALMSDGIDTWTVVSEVVHQQRYECAGLQLGLTPLS